MSEIDFSKRHANDDPLTGNNFIVRIKGTEIGGFERAEGLGINANPVRYSPGGKTTEMILPNTSSCNDVALIRGFTKHRDFVNWIMESVRERRSTVKYNVELIVQNVNGDSLRGFELINARPIAWMPRDVLNTNGGYALEELTLAPEDVVPIEF